MGGRVVLVLTLAAIGFFAMMFLLEGLAFTGAVTPARDVQVAYANYSAREVSPLYIRPVVSPPISVGPLHTSLEEGVGLLVTVGLVLAVIGLILSDGSTEKAPLRSEHPDPLPFRRRRPGLDIDGRRAA